MSIWNCGDWTNNWGINFIANWLLVKGSDSLRIILSHVGIRTSGGDVAMHAFQTPGIGHYEAIVVTVTTATYIMHGKMDVIDLHYFWTLVIMIQGYMWWEIPPRHDTINTLWFIHASLWCSFSETQGLVEYLLYHVAMFWVISQYISSDSAIPC